MLLLYKRLVLRRLRLSCMKARDFSRRKLLVTAGASAVAQAPPAFASSPVDRAGAALFLQRWDDAWNRHDAEALGALHTEDAVTVNRFGTLVPDGAAVTRALGFLHSPKGPFGETTFPSQRILALRQIVGGVLSLQTAWKNPVMHPDGSIDPTSWNDMVVSFVLVRRGPDWRATSVDAHNVEKMDLPFSSDEQKKS